jgi:hypothetical protein
VPIGEAQEDAALAGGDTRGEGGRGAHRWGRRGTEEAGACVMSSDAGLGSMGSVGRHEVGRHMIRSHGVIRAMWGRAGGARSVRQAGGVDARRVRARGDRSVDWIVGSM